jgi:hypothetical protein
MAVAVVAIAGGLALTWSWLVAASLAPVVLALLPCAAVCALGLCMNHGDKGSCKKEAAAQANAPRGQGP